MSRSDIDKEAISCTVDVWVVYRLPLYMQGKYSFDMYIVGQGEQFKIVVRIVSVLISSQFEV